MKKILFFLCFSLASVSVGWSSPIGFGLKSGIDIAGQNYKTVISDISVQPLIGFTGGLFVDVNFFDFLSLQTETNFTIKGHQEVDKNFSVYDSMSNFLGTTTDTLSFNFQYLEIPLLVKTPITLSSGLKGYLLTGPSLSILLNETTTLSQVANGNVPAFSESVDDTRYFPGTDWGLVFGGGVEFMNFLLDVRLDLGLDPASEKGYIGSSTITNNVLSFEVGYRIK